MALLGGAFVGIIDMLRHTVSITQFNKGKAAQLFSRVKKGEPLVVLKNNAPVAVVVSPEDYEIIENYNSNKEVG